MEKKEAVGTRRQYEEQEKKLNEKINRALGFVLSREERYVI